MIEVNIQYGDGRTETLKLTTHEAGRELSSFLNGYCDSGKMQWVEKMRGTTNLRYPW